MDLDILKRLEEVITDHPELLLLVEHNLLVDGKQRVLKYKINMVEMEAKFFSSFISSEMHAEVMDSLSTDKAVFKLLLILAFGLRALI